jgi:flagellar biosynthetic protein FlhB
LAEQQDQEKTEAPTERRRQKARDEGQVAFSKELTSSFMLGGAALLLFATSSFFMESIQEVMHSGFTRIAMEQDFTVYFLAGELGAAFLPVLPVLALLALVLLALGILLSAVQVGFQITGKPLAPKFERLSPLSGIKRLFSSQAIADFMKSMAKLVIVGVIGYLSFQDMMVQMNGLSVVPPEEIIIFNFEAIAIITGKIVLALLAIAIFDVFYQRWYHEQQLMMTKQEMKEENKETEGDPQLKSRIRQIQREMSNARMMQEVPKADALVVNPTHFAVALKYDREVMSAPQVTAKGMDFLALRMRTVARENSVPIIEKPALARELYAGVEIGESIPERFYKAVAEILAQIYRLRGRR